jgi:hypothetical protein
VPQQLASEFQSFKNDSESIKAVRSLCLDALHGGGKAEYEARLSSA